MRDIFFIKKCVRSFIEVRHYVSACKNWKQNATLRKERRKWRDRGKEQRKIQQAGRKKKTITDQQRKTKDEKKKKRETLQRL